jgi:hypothetical protein
MTWGAVLALGACVEGQRSPALTDAGGEARPGDDDAGTTAPDRPSASCEVPSTAAPLLSFLRAGAYRNFARESGPHSSAGPHGGRVLTYVNDILAGALARGSAAKGEQHPRCAASIKELFLGGDAVAGWAVLVKTDDDSSAGRGIYWFETTSLDPDRAPAYQGAGLGLCVSCHAAGRDYVLTPWPLQ